MTTFTIQSQNQSAEQIAAVSVGVLLLAIVMIGLILHRRSARREGSGKQLENAVTPNAPALRVARLAALLSVPVLLMPATGVEPPKKAPVAADFGDPPASVLEHYKCCLEKEDIDDQTVLLRAFWDEHHPRDGEYDDSVHGRMVLLCAYRLAENYSRMNCSDEVILLLNWIRSEDTRLMEEERMPAKPAGGKGK